MLSSSVLLMYSM